MGKNNQEVFTTSGTIHQIGEIEEFGDKGFRVRKIVLHMDQDEKWQQFVPFSGIYEMCDTLSRFKPGDDVEVKYWLEGRQDKKNPTRFWGTLQLKDIEIMGQAEANDFNAAEPEAMGDDSAPF